MRYKYDLVAGVEELRSRKKGDRELVHKMVL